MAEFAYNNARNASTGHIFFKLNYRYHSHILYKKNFNPRPKLKTAEKLSFDPQNLMIVCQQNFYCPQKYHK